MNLAELQACLASAVRYIQNHSGITTSPYFDEIPESFIVPSMYFPVPRTESHKVTLSTWRTDIHMECWFAAATTWQAFSYADTVRDSILADDCAIDIMEEDGTVSGSYLRVTEPTVRKQEERIVRMAFTIKDYHEYEPEVTLAESFYYTWYAATRGTG